MMPTLSSKRQITVPKEMCDRLDVHPGDELEFLEHDRVITIIKKVAGSSAGILKHLKPDSRYTDDESLQEEVEHNQI